MSAGISQHDRAYLSVNNTWHNNPQYQCVGHQPVTVDQALEISEYPIELQLFLGHHIGVTAYICAATTMRVVCDNTYKMATDTAQELARIRHTSGAASKIVDQLDLMAKLRLDLQGHVDELEYLTTQDLNRDYVSGFLDRFFPVKNTDGSEKTGRGLTIAKNHRKSFVEILEVGDNALSTTVNRSRYGLWQAFTDYTDHASPVRNGDEHTRTWDALVGSRAKQKEEVFAHLLK